MEKNEGDRVVAFVVISLPDRRPEAVSGFANASLGGLYLGHLFRLRSLGALRHFEFNFLALFEGLEAVALNGAVVNEDI